MPDLNRYHPAVEAASKAWGDSAPTTTAMWAGMSEHRRDLVRVRMAESLKSALPYLTADDLRATPAGRELMAETWSKFQEHYATEWEEAYPEDVFPSPAPAPAVVSRESVAASMMRQWAKNLRSDHNPFEEDDA